MDESAVQGGCDAARELEALGPLRGKQCVIKRKERFGARLPFSPAHVGNKLCKEAEACRAGQGAGLSFSQGGLASPAEACGYDWGKIAFPKAFVFPS